MSVTKARLASNGIVLKSALTINRIDSFFVKTLNGRSALKALNERKDFKLFAERNPAASMIDVFFLAKIIELNDKKFLKIKI